VYSAFLDTLTLSSIHQQALKARGLIDGLMDAGYRTLPDGPRYQEVRRLIDAGLEESLPTVPGFYIAVSSKTERRYWTVGGKAGLLIPVRDCQQRIVALMIRPDKLSEGGKYRWMSSKRRGGAGPGAPVHVPLWKTGYDRTTVRITEGPLKADIATRLSGMLTIGLASAGTWTRTPAVLKELGAKIGRVALDVDASQNRIVGEALYRLVEQLMSDGFPVELETWSWDKGKGIDDVIAAGHQPDLTTGDSVRLVAQGIASLAGVFNRPCSAPPDSVVNGSPQSNEQPASQTLVEILLDHLKTIYEPLHRRDQAIWSRKLGTTVDLRHASIGPDTPLLKRMLTAIDCPRDREGNPNERAVRNDWRKYLERFRGSCSRGL
jgi:hypothetical protein